MRLNMNRLPTLKKILSPEMYDIYINNNTDTLNNIGISEYNGRQVYSYVEDGEEQFTFENLTDDVKLMIASEVLKKAMYYTPVDTGYLKSSAYIKAFGAGFEIGYTADYAIYVHEMGDNLHKLPGQYKYLEDAAFEVIEDYIDVLNIPISVKMQYDPLRVFIGDSNAPGQDLFSIKDKEFRTSNTSYYTRLLNKFLTFDKENASKEELLYYEKMSKFFEYYRVVRKKSDSSIIVDWVDRMRHY